MIRLLLYVFVQESIGLSVYKLVTFRQRTRKIVKKIESLKKKNCEKKLELAVKIVFC